MEVKARGVVHIPRTWRVTQSLRKRSALETSMGESGRTPDNRRGAQYPLLDILEDFGPPRSEKMTDIWAKIAGKSEEKSDI